MGCNCKKPEFNYVGKWILFQNTWFEVKTQNRLDGTLGIIYGGVLAWIRPARIQAISDSAPEAE